METEDAERSEKYTLQRLSDGAYYAGDGFWVRFLEQIEHFFKRSELNYMLQLRTIQEPVVIVHKNEIPKIEEKRK